MPNFTDRLTPAEREIVRYLLADVNDEEHVRIGEKSVVDLEYGELVDAMEFDLTFAYIRGRLSPSERTLFENNFHVTDERKDRTLALEALVKASDRRKKQPGS